MATPPRGSRRVAVTAASESGSREEGRPARRAASPARAPPAAGSTSGSGPPFGPPEMRQTARPGRPVSRRYLMVGSAARIRVLSVTTPSLTGQLKSTRTSARLPSSARSGRATRGVRFTAADSDVAQQVHAPGRVAHLVVVPRGHVHQRAVDHVGGERVHRAGVQVADVVHRDQRLVAHRQHTLERRRSRPPHGTRRSLRRRVVVFSTVQVSATTDTSGVGTRSDTPSILPLSSGITSAVAFAAPVRGRDDRQRRRARAPQILVRQVEDLLVVGVGVHRGHEAVHEAELGRGSPSPPAPGSWWCSSRWR